MTVCNQFNLYLVYLLRIIVLVISIVMGGAFILIHYAGVDYVYADVVRIAETVWFATSVLHFIYFKAVGHLFGSDREYTPVG